MIAVTEPASIQTHVVKRDANSSVGLPDRKKNGKRGAEYLRVRLRLWLANDLDEFMDDLFHLLKHATEADRERVRLVCTVLDKILPDAREPSHSAEQPGQQVAIVINGVNRGRPNVEGAATRSTDSDIGNEGEFDNAD